MPETDSRVPAAQPSASDIQLAIYRRMTPMQRLEAPLRRRKLARELVKAGVARRHPDASPEDRQEKLRHLMLYGRE